MKFILFDYLKWDWTFGHFIFWGSIYKLLLFKICNQTKMHVILDDNHVADVCISSSIRFVMRHWTNGIMLHRICIAIYSTE